MKTKINFITTIVALMAYVSVNAQGVAIGDPRCLPGFTDEAVSNGWADVRQVTFDSIGRMFVVEGEGKVYIIDTLGVKQITPLIDISEEVGWWNAHGLLGMALDKDYLTNGYFYLMYTVDRHYLLHYGDSTYNSSVDEYHDATITRITRYKADSSTNFTVVLPGSRYILLGSNKKNGIPVTYNNHDGGGIVMSPDGSLLITTGDAGHGGAVDTGSNSQTYYVHALSDSIIKPEENVGAYRAQEKQSLCGKLLRIDPMTGLGLPSNPFYDAAHPDYNESKVWSLGLRNPFRFSIRPATALSNNMAAGKPGDLFICQVGFHTWEDMYVADSPGKNFGWPVYEGMFLQPFFSIQTIQDKFAPNPQYGVGGCTNQYFKFIDLIINATLDTNPMWYNPCDSAIQVPTTMRYMRSRPILSYNHVPTTCYVPGYVGNDPTQTEVGTAGSPATGTELVGTCIAGCDWNSGNGYPAQFNNKLFFVDYAKGFMAYLNIDTNNQVIAVDTFATTLGNPISVVYNKKQKCMYYVEYPYEIHRIRYTYGLNTAPKAKATQNIHYGPGPLAVNFSGQSSTDPENAPLTYFWNFGDGNTSTLVAPQHTFNPPTSNPTKYTINLTVTDTGGLTGTAQLIVSVNNTPPVVQITSPVNGTYYSELIMQVYNLTANVTDAEHDSTHLHWSWYTALHHNLHVHPNPIDTNKSSYLVTDPEDCIDNYYYQITLTVTDDAGLSTSQTVEIYQNCPLDANFTSDITSVCRDDSVHYYATVVSHADSVYWVFQNGSPATSKSFNPVVAYKTGYGGRDVTLIAYNIFGSDTLFVADYMFIKSNVEVNQNITGTLVRCFDDSIQLSTNDSSIFKYQWKKNGISLINDTLSTYLAKTTGIYKVVVSMPLNGCSKTSIPLNYVEHIIDATLTLSGSNVLCNTDSVVITTDTDPSYSYQWYKNSNPIAGATSYYYEARSTGSYYAAINDTNTCAATTNTMNVVQTPEALIFYTGDSIICPAGDVVVLDANVGAGLTYQWYFNGNLIAGANSSSYTATNTGNYKVFISDAGGCYHYSNNLYVDGCFGIIDNSINGTVNIYPNPTTNALQISFVSDDSSLIKIRIIDVLGKILMSETLENKVRQSDIELRTSSLPQGVYQIMIESDTFHAVKRFVKK